MNLFNLPIPNTCNEIIETFDDYYNTFYRVKMKLIWARCMPYTKKYWFNKLRFINWEIYKETERIITLSLQQRHCSCSNRCSFTSQIWIWRLSSFIKSFWSINSTSWSWICSFHKLVCGYSYSPSQRRPVAICFSSCWPSNRMDQGPWPQSPTVSGC